MTKRTIVIASGYFNPIHKGHIDYLERAAKLGDYLFVIVNNDKQVALKGAQRFMDEKERLRIVSSIRYVDKAIISVDKDKTVRESIERFVMANPKTLERDTVIFAKGGDRTKKNIPEAKVCKGVGIKVVDGLGKKVQSSSKLLGKLKK